LNQLFEKKTNHDQFQFDHGWPISNLVASTYLA
jgi:hypothetical protein